MFSKLNKFIDEISKIKNVSKEVVVEALENAFVSLSKKRMGEMGPIANVGAQYVAEDDKVYVYQYKNVVDEVSQPIVEISLVEAQKEDPDVVLGDELGFLLDEEHSSVRRKEIQIFKQILFQKIKDAERRVLMDNFSDKKGKIVSGIIKRIDQYGNALVDLGAAEATLQKRDMLIGDELSQNSKVSALLVDVSRKGSGGPTIRLSRSHHMYLVRLLEEECPRVEDGTIEIIKMAREGGLRSKVVVRSTDSNVNPLSEILGDNGYRIQEIINKLEGEKINIIPYTNDKQELLELSMRPGSFEAMVEYDDHIDIIADEAELGKIIGKRGSNLKTAASIMGKRINVITNEKLSEVKQLSREEFKQVEGLSDLLSEELIARFVFGAEMLSNQNEKAVASALSISEDDAIKLVESAKKLINSPNFESKLSEVDMVESYGLPKDYPLPNTSSEGSTGLSAEQRLREELAAFNLK